MRGPIRPGKWWVFLDIVAFAGTGFRGGELRTRDHGLSRELLPNRLSTYDDLWILAGGLREAHSEPYVDDGRGGDSKRCRTRSSGNCF